MSWLYWRSPNHHHWWFGRRLGYVRVHRRRQFVLLPFGIGDRRLNVYFGFGRREGVKA